ncbi:hypothetical protein LINGRAHAP2_LOCUS100 [Linum grandiflorum]
MTKSAEELNLSPVPPPAAASSEDDAGSSSDFSTPNAKEHQIPDPTTCPPPPVRAPRKRMISPEDIRNLARMSRTVLARLSLTEKLSDEVPPASSSPSPRLFR